MHSKEPLSGTVIDQAWLTIEQVSAICLVEPDWLLQHIEEGLLPGAVSLCGIWHLSSSSLRRARRMRELERDFDAAPELAALVGDLLDELDTLRRQVRQPRQ